MLGFDRPQGVGDWLSDVTAFPSALTVAASWDVGLLQRFGSTMAVEQRQKGMNVLLGLVDSELQCKNKKELNRSLLDITMAQHMNST